MPSSAAVDGTWDYVIVGAGAAGCVLANRLSADGTASVLLLEAGGEARGPAVKVPALIQKLSADLNWLYPIEPDPSRGGVSDTYSGGRLLGGSTSINAMMWVRGNHNDYDGWAAEGCTGWSYHDVLPSFRRAEKFEDGESRYRGGRGPQRVARTRVRNPMIDVFIAAAAQAGFPTRDDYNAADQNGVSLTQVTQRRGLRASAYDSYLRPVRKRSNLEVRTGARVTRVEIEDRRAIGVKYVGAGGTRVARARREVILSAGALASPKLLMLSGVGPAGRLRELGIDVVADLPGVGRNLQEHPCTSMVYEVRARTLNQDLTPLRLAVHAADFVLRGRGAITSTSNHAVAFGSSGASSAVPDMELIFMAFGLVKVAEAAKPRDATGVLRRVMARSGGRAEGRSQVAAEPLVTMHATLLQPRARGEVTLRSADPDDPPVIRQQLLGAQEDVEGLVGACRRVRDIFATEAMSGYVVGERVPGRPVESDEEWEAHLRGSVFRLHHPTSTCAMGTGPLSVVDPRLRVHGIDGLRVIDASVMPTIPRGNTNAPTVMVAERGSDFVRADNGA